MRSSLIGTCRTYIHNQDVLAETMRFSSVTTIHAAALLLAQERRRLDVEQMKKIREIFTEETSLFSAFRGSAQLVALALLSGADDPRTAHQQYQTPMDTSFFDVEKGGRPRRKDEKEQIYALRGYLRHVFYLRKIDDEKAAATDPHSRNYGDNERHC